MTTHAPHGHAAHDHASHDHAGHEDDLTALLDLDAEVLHEHLAELTGWVADLAGDQPPGRILDLGAGTGAGTVALLARFPRARVTAVDTAPARLARLREKAAALGVSRQVTIVEADLDGPWPAFAPADLAWASAALHHLADPGRGLGQARAALRPGGLLAVIEPDGLPRFLPDDPGPGFRGLEDRCRAALASRNAEAVPHLGADWAPWLTRAGFAAPASRRWSIELPAPLPAAARRYARTTLARMRAALDGSLSPDDAAALDRLTADAGADSVLERDDLLIRAERAAWIARRPPALA